SGAPRRSASARRCGSGTAPSATTASAPGADDEARPGDGSVVFDAGEEDGAGGEGEASGGEVPRARREAAGGGDAGGDPDPSAPAAGHERGEPGRVVEALDDLLGGRVVLAGRRLGAGVAEDGLPGRLADDVGGGEAGEAVGGEEVDGEGQPAVGGGGGGGSGHQACLPGCAPVEPARRSRPRRPATASRAGTAPAPWPPRRRGGPSSRAARAGPEGRGAPRRLGRRAGLPPAPRRPSGGRGPPSPEPRRHRRAPGGTSPSRPGSRGAGGAAR